MHDFQYVPRSEYQPLKNEIIELLNIVQDEVREHFTFQYHFIGSTKRNMITQDMKSNIGFDFDVNIKVNDDEENYPPDKIRTILRIAITNVSRRFGFTRCEDSTRVITIIKANRWRSVREHSCDFAVVYNKQYIRFNKGKGTYTWEYQSKNYMGVEKRADILKDNGYWNEVRDVYIEKKNHNDIPAKRSRSLYIETINEVYKRFTNANK